MCCAKPDKTSVRESNNFPLFFSGRLSNNPPETRTSFLGKLTPGSTLSLSVFTPTPEPQPLSYTRPAWAALLFRYSLPASSRRCSHSSLLHCSPLNSAAEVGRRPAHSPSLPPLLVSRLGVASQDCPLIKFNHPTAIATIHSLTHLTIVPVSPLAFPLLVPTFVRSTLSKQGN